MKTFTKGAMIAATAALGLSLAACESKKEEAAEATADAVENSSDAAADSLDAAAASTSGETADKLNDKADAVRASGNTKAEAIKDNADKKD
ncbi:MAG: hypothetical protein RIS94_498 [Pseudomonadota bacterium]|jgi:methylthioribose-1-phosphate isomerase